VPTKAAAVIPAPISPKPRTDRLEFPIFYTFFHTPAICPKAIPVVPSVLIRPAVVAVPSYTCFEKF